MNEFGWMHVIWAVGALALCIGAFASYQMNWRKSVTYILIWASIFTAVTLFINAVAL